MSESTTIGDRIELQCALAEATRQKNRMLHRGGASPVQLVFGINPRIAADLMSDHALQELGNQELSEPSGDQVTAAAEFRKAARVRDAVREALTNREATAKLRLAATRKAHQDRTFSQGQWVYARRRQAGPAAQRSLSISRDRWIGPGVVVLQSGYIAWVGLRRRI